MMRISVAIPVHRATARFERACHDIARQTITDLDILLILNGADDDTQRRAAEVTRADTRIRIIELPEANLAAALNVALEAAHAPILARMDADDACPPHRLERQLAHLATNPGLAGVGCAWEIADEHDRVIATVRPPCDPREMRWRLLLGNPLAHGAMVLRRDVVRAIGGYDPACRRAQDYDLWLRLIAHHDIAAVPDVLYRHHTRHADVPTSSTADQADAVAPRLVRAWADLPRSSEPAPITTAVHDALTQQRDPVAIRAALERTLSEQGPSVEALTAWLWSHHTSPPAPRTAYDAARRARLREVGTALRARGITSIWLWGAGDHTRWLLEHIRDLGLNIAGIVDDSLAGQVRFGCTIQPPAVLQPGHTVILSSDWHEDQLWHASAPARAAGVNVVRLYG